MNISSDDLQLLLELAAEATGNGRPVDPAIDKRLGALADSIHNIDADGDPVMYLMSRVAQESDNFQPVPLYVFHDKDLALRAQRLLQRGSGITFDILPIPVEG